MLVKCLHFSMTYPDGQHRKGDIFELSKKDAERYESYGWVDILPKQLQPKRKGRPKKVSNNPPARDIRIPLI